jgi:hypothetical protein
MNTYGRKEVTAKKIDKGAKKISKETFKAAMKEASVRSCGIEAARQGCIA